MIFHAPVRAIIMERKTGYGWVVTFVVFLVYILNMGIPMYGATIINTKMALEQGLDITVLGYATTACGVVRAITAAFGGKLVSRLGARRTMALGSLSAAMVAAVLAFLPLGVYAKILVFGLFGVGIVFGAILTTPVLIRQWFEKNSALPMSIALSAGSVSGMVAAVAIEKITGLWGWRSGWLTGVLCALGALLLTTVLLRDGPFQAAPAEQIRKAEKKQTCRRGKAYFVLVSSYAIRTMSYLVIVSYVVVLMLDAGYSSASGAQALVVISAAGLAGRLIQGFAGRTRLNLNIQAAIACLGQSAGCLLILAGSLPAMMLGCGMLGFCYGAGYILMPLLNAKYFSLQDYAQVTGETITWGAVFGAAGPMLATMLIHTNFGFGGVLAALACFCGLSGLSNLLLNEKLNDILKKKPIDTGFP